MDKLYAGALSFCALAACASQPPPTEHLAASMAAVRGAETAGAANIPQAALHLKLAEEQIEQARKMMSNGDNERADAMTIRAFNDADLALAMTREAESKQKLESYAEAHPEVTSAAEPRGNDEPLDATNPPSIGAPQAPTSKDR